MRLRPPIDIHESAVEQYYARAPGGAPEADPTIAALASAVRQTRQSSESLAAYADQLAADRTQSPDAARLRLRDNALALAEKTARRLDEAQAKVRTEIEEIDVRTGTPPALRDTHSAGIEAEIRARLAAMPEEARDEAIAAALTARDTTIVSAVLRGPALLTGLSPARYEALRQRYRATFHAEEAARRARLAAALEATERSGRAFVKFIRGATTAGADVAEAAARAASAEAAIRAAIADKE